MALGGTIEKPRNSSLDRRVDAGRSPAAGASRSQAQLWKPLRHGLRHVFAACQDRSRPEILQGDAHKLQAYLYLTPGISKG
jgi:hypothetical protein